MANPEISKIKFPSGNVYDIKDATAREMIAGGVKFDIVWKQSDYESATAPSAATLAQIPSGVVVQYNNGASTATGTLPASADTVGIFYLVYSATHTSEGVIDKYDEYVTITDGEGSEATYSFEKLGDTQIDLSGVVTGVTLNKITDTVIGSDATLTLTNPTVTIPANKVITDFSNISASATLSSGSSGDVTVATGGTTKYMGTVVSGGDAD